MRIKNKQFFQVERLFLLSRDFKFHQYKVFRASEIYLNWKNGDSLKKLDDKKYQLLVKIRPKLKLIVQIRNFSPASLHATQRHFKSLPEVKSTRFSRWKPSR